MVSCVEPYAGKGLCAPPFDTMTRIFDIVSTSEFREILQLIKQIVLKMIDYFVVCPSYLASYPQM